jgi:predicted aspartyl protease
MDGAIDDLRRAVLRVEAPPPHSDGLRCQIDTGFNRYLLLERSVAGRFGFRELPGSLRSQVVLGDGSIRFAWLARGTILWFGDPLVVEAHIIPDMRQRRYLSPENQIDALIGTALLDGLRVVLDFHRRTVTIDRVEDE